MIVHLTMDLMFTSQVGGICEQAGKAYRAVSKASRLQSLVADEAVSVQMVIVDLQAPGLDLADLKDILATIPDVPSLAYAQHVETEILDAATNSGFDRVVTRGQFHAEVRDIVASA